jgi:hypothetical protein
MFNRFKKTGFAEKLINIFRNKIVLSEGSHTEGIEDSRTPVNVVSFFSEQYQEVSRGTAAEQKSSPLRSEIIFGAQKDHHPGVTNLDPVTLGNLVLIGLGQ